MLKFERIESKMYTNRPNTISSEAEVLSEIWKEMPQYIHAQTILMQGSVMEILRKTSSDIVVNEKQQNLNIAVRSIEYLEEEMIEILNKIQYSKEVLKNIQLADKLEG